MALLSSNRQNLGILLFFLVALSFTICTSKALRGKKFDCKLFCQKSAFRGSVGNCHCGFALFSSKRSQIPRNIPPIENKGYDAVMQVLFPDFVSANDNKINEHLLDYERLMAQKAPFNGAFSKWLTEPRNQEDNDQNEIYQN